MGDICLKLKHKPQRTCVLCLALGVALHLLLLLFSFELRLAWVPSPGFSQSLWLSESKSVSASNSRPMARLSARNSGNGTMVVSMDISETRTAMHVSSEYNHVAYASAHGYQWLTARTADFFPQLNRYSLTPHFQKGAFVHKLLVDNTHTVDYVLWLDFDAIVVNCTVTVESLIQRTLQMYPPNTFASANDNGSNLPDLIVSGCVRTSVLNNGVMLMRNSAWTRAFIREWAILSAVFGAVDGGSKTLVRLWDQSVMLMQFHGLKASDLLPATARRRRKQPMEAMTMAEEIDEIMNAYSSKQLLFEHLNRTGHFHESAMLKKTATKEESLFAQRVLLAAELRTHIGIVPSVWLNTYTNYGDAQFIVHFAGERKYNLSPYIKQFTANSTCNKIKYPLQN